MGYCISCLRERRADVQGQKYVQAGIGIQNQTGIEDQRVDVTGIEDLTVDIQEEKDTADQNVSVQDVGGTEDQGVDFQDAEAIMDQGDHVQDETCIDDQIYSEDLTGSSSRTQISTSSSSICLWSCASPPDSTSFLFMTELQRRHLYDSSSYWIYARTLDNQNVQSFHALDIQQHKHEQSYVPLPPYPLDELADSATAVLGKKLYVIGGRIDRFEHSNVYVYDPEMYKWCGVAPTIISRRGAVAATVHGRIYVFGGCSDQTDPWGEMYEPSTQKWTGIPSSQTLIDALHIGFGFDPVLSSTVLGNKIFIRSSGNGIVFDVESSAWSPFPLNLLNYWWNGASTAAVVQNLLITCHREYNKDVPRHELSIRAYDPEIDAWLKLEGLEIFFHGDAYRSDFMTVNGKLVIYHMWDIDHLRFSVIEINEKLQTGLVVNLLWSCWLHRFQNQRILAKPAHSFST